MDNPAQQVGVDDFAHFLEVRFVTPLLKRHRPAFVFPARGDHGVQLIAIEGHRFFHHNVFSPSERLDCMRAVEGVWCSDYDKFKFRIGEHVFQRRGRPAAQTLRNFPEPFRMAICHRGDLKVFRHCAERLSVNIPAAASKPGDTHLDRRIRVHVVKPIKYFVFEQWTDKLSICTYV